MARLKISQVFQFYFYFILKSVICFTLGQFYDHLSIFSFNHLCIFNNFNYFGIVNVFCFLFYKGLIYSS